MIKARGLAELERGYQRAADLLEVGEARAVKRAGVTIRANQARGISKIINLKISVIKDAIEVVERPVPGSPRIRYEVVGGAIALREFAARQTKKGVSVQVFRGGGRKLLRRAFMARGYGGNLQVFERTGLAKVVPKVGSYAGREYKLKPGYYKREPIEKLFGPDVFSQYIKDVIQRLGEVTWDERIIIELDRESEFALKRAGLI